MKNKRNLKEVGLSLFIFGLSMLLFPSIFKNSTVHHYEYPDNIYFGIPLVIIGLFIFLIRLYIEKKT